MIDQSEGKKASHGRGSSPSFSEIIGQEELKRALLAVVADDDLDGLLVRGEKGTAKSTAVRALADLLLRQDVVEGCPYGCPPNAPERQCEACRERTDPPSVQRRVPLVTLPLGATRERVVGALSVADALGGDYEFDPGLLARANRGVLYVDEVNLLDDHLVDVLLDAAASGVNRVERDGVSVSHPARFTLVGTMNPEEGDLRPQLRDRFALQATVTACEDVDQRVSIIDRAIGLTEGNETGARDDRGPGMDDPSAGTDGRPVDDDYRDRLRRAREGLPEVDIPTEFVRQIAELCRDSGADGHRGDIATARAARTLAALDGRSKVIEPDVRRAAELALPHRLRSRPFEDAPDPGELIDNHFDDADGDDGARDDRGERADGEGGDADEERADDGEKRERVDADQERERTNTDQEREGTNPDEERADDAEDASPGGDGSGTVGESDPAGANGSETESRSGSTGRNGEREATETGASGSERADETGAGDVEGDETDGEPTADDDGDEPGGTPIVPGQSRAGVGAGRAPDPAIPEAVESGGAGSGTRSGTTSDIDADGPRLRTRRADSPRRIDAAASIRAASARGASSVESRDLRQSVRRSDASALVLFVVDASASMRPAMRAAKGTVIELLKDAYRKRDEVAFVAFAGDEADVLLPPTDSVTLAARHLKDLPTGDRTPLPAGLRTASDVLDRAEPATSVVVLVTDGRANVARGSPVRETREAARRLAEFDPHVVVVDAGDGGDRSGVTDVIADETGGERVPLAALSAERIDDAVGDVRERQV
jgi:magnesium chelatase subunit D